MTDTAPSLREAIMESYAFEANGTTVALKFHTQEQASAFVTARVDAALSAPAKEAGHAE